MTLNIKATYSDMDVVIVAFLRMSTSNFQWRHDGLGWRIKLMQNTPTASLFYCRVSGGHDTFIFPKN